MGVMLAKFMWYDLARNGGRNWFIFNERLIGCVKTKCCGIKVALGVSFRRFVAIIASSI